ncbi:MAG TPA: translation initiation factor IF-3 [Candidatus Saccharimonadales bacterium]
MSTKDDTKVNRAIRAPKLRVIDENGQQAGVITLSEALERAEQAGLDLVEVSPQAEPPVARIIDWGKYVYQKQKQQNKKKQKSQDLKQVRMGLKIGSHDFDIKLRKIREFLEAGHQVRISAFFRGREMAHKDLGYVLLDRVLKTIEDVAVVEQEPQMAGRYLSLQVRKK